MFILCSFPFIVCLQKSSINNVPPNPTVSAYTVCHVSSATAESIGAAGAAFVSLSVKFSIGGDE